MTDTVKIDVRLEREVYDKYRAAADGYGLPLGTVIGHVLREQADNLVPPDEFKLTRW